MFGEAFTATDFASAPYETEFVAFCDWSTDCDCLPQQEPEPPSWDWRASWPRSFGCSDEFQLPAKAPEDASLDWRTPPSPQPPHLSWPPFSRATLGEALSANDFDSAFCEIEVDAFWLWLVDCDFGAALLVRKCVLEGEAGD